MNTTINRDWFILDSQCFSIADIVCFGLASNGGERQMVVRLRGGHIVTINATTQEMIDSIKATNS